MGCTQARSPVDAGISRDAGTRGPQQDAGTWGPCGMPACMASHGMCTHMVPHGSQASGVPVGCMHTQSPVGHRQGWWKHPRDLPYTRSNATQEPPPAQGTNPCWSPTRLPARPRTLPGLPGSTQTGSCLAVAEVAQVPAQPFSPQCTRWDQITSKRCSLCACCVGVPCCWWFGSARAGRHCATGPLHSTGTMVFGKHQYHRGTPREVSKPD